MVAASLVRCFFWLLPAAESVASINPVYTTVADHIERTRLYGNINAFAYYFAEILVGTPPQRVSVILDTGSGLCAFPCVECSHCGEHIDVAFNRTASKTARALPCAATGCDRCLEGSCGYLEEYTEGSRIEGIWFVDLVTLNGSDKDNKPVFANLGCHHTEKALFYTQKVNGILGLAPHKITGRSNVLQDFFRDKTHVNQEVFSLCLAEWGGLWTVGGYDASFFLPGAALHWVPFHHAGYYGLPLEEVRCGAQLVAGEIDFGTTILDTGTTFSYFPHSVYLALVTALKTQCTGSACGGTLVPEAPESAGVCWKLLNETSPHHFPNMSLIVGTGYDKTTFTWQPHAYMFRRSRAENEWCLAIADNMLTHTTVLGTSFFLHKTIVFDMSQSKLGFATSACPENHYHSPQDEAGRLSLLGEAQQMKLPHDPQRRSQPAMGQIHLIACVLGATGLLLLLVAFFMCLWAYMVGEDDEDDESEVQLADQKSFSE